MPHFSWLQRHFIGTAKAKRIVAFQGTFLNSIVLLGCGGRK
jgi:hypothetical protein